MINANYAADKPPDNMSKEQGASFWGHSGPSTGHWPGSDQREQHEATHTPGTDHLFASQCNARLAQHGAQKLPLPGRHLRHGRRRTTEIARQAVNAAERATGDGRGGVLAEELAVELDDWLGNGDGE